MSPTNTYFSVIKASINREQGKECARLFSLSCPKVDSMELGSTDLDVLKRRYQSFVKPFDQLLPYHIKALEYAIECNWGSSHEIQSLLVQSLPRQFSDIKFWMLPIVLQVCDNLRWLAVKISVMEDSNGKTQEKLEEAARSINKVFTLCATDRSSSLYESKRSAVVSIATILFKIYFKLHQTSLCHNLLRAIKSSEIIDLDSLPKSHSVPFRYFNGRLSIIEEHYFKADHELSLALRKCPISAIKQRQRILTYLIPIKMLKGILPRDKTLHTYRLNLFREICKSIRHGDIRLFSETLETHSKALLSKFIYLPIERLHYIIYRKIFKNTFISLSRNVRLRLEVFQCALKIMGEDVELTEVACIAANLIDKGLINGYISEEHNYLVFSRANPFPIICSINLK